jgi:Flavodoxin
MNTAIIFATKYGSTAEVARRLASVFNEKADLFDIAKDRIPSLDPYETVIIGGSVYMGRIQKKLRSYLETSRQELLSKRVGLYLCAAHPDLKTRQDELRQAFPEALYNHALIKDILGYALIFEKMHLMDRFIMSKIKGDKLSVSSYDDDKIQAFAEALGNYDRTV